MFYSNEVTAMAIILMLSFSLLFFVWAQVILDQTHNMTSVNPQRARYRIVAITMVAQAGIMFIMGVMLFIDLVMLMVFA